MPEFFDNLFSKYVFRIKKASKPGNWVGLCPFHDDKTPSFYFTDDGLFHCFGCDTKGNAITFAKMVGEQLPNLANMKRTKVKADVWSAPEPLSEEYIGIVNEAQDRLLLNYDTMVDDLPWNKTAVERLNIGWANNTFVFPYLNEDGKLVNIKWHKQKQVTGHANTYIFPMWHMVHKYDPKKTLYIAEGEKDVVSLISSGKQAITLNNGAMARWPNYLVKLVVDKFEELFPYFDNDDAGRMASEKFIERFARYAVA